MSDPEIFPHGEPPAAAQPDTDAITTVEMLHLLNREIGIIRATRPNFPRLDPERDAVVFEAIIERLQAVAPAAALQAKSVETQSWAVTVERNGENIVTLASNCLSGRDLSEEDERIIGLAADHLRAFLGAPAAALSPTPSDELQMLRARQVCERLKHTYTASDVTFVFEQLQHVRRYAESAALSPSEEPKP